MKIAIIGAGAIGGLFASHLAKAGESVVVIDVWQEHVIEIRKVGLTLETAEGERVVRLTAEVRTEGLGKVDLVIICVKSSRTREAARSSLQILAPHSRVLTLQNGLGNAEVIAEVVGMGRVLAGTTAMGATLLSVGRIRHGGRGITHIGMMEGAPDEFCRKVAETFSQAGLPTRAEEDVRALVWGKLVINAGINALTALLGCNNGKLAVIGEARELMTLVVEEAVAVAAAAGAKLPYADAVAKVLEVAQATADNRSSMLQDVMRGQKTEIEVINGALVREGERLGVPTPVNRLLVLLIGALEQVV